jgi:hypothetical protein
MHVMSPFVEQKDVAIRGYPPKFGKSECQRWRNVTFQHIATCYYIKYKIFSKVRLLCWTFRNSLSLGVCQLGVHVRSIAKHSQDVFVYKIFLSQFVWYVNMKWHHWQGNFRHSQRWLYFLRIQDGDMHNDFFEMKWNIFYTKSVKRFWNILNQSSNWEKLIFIAISL